MVNLAQAWAEQYHATTRTSCVQVLRRRLGRGHRQPDRRQLRHGQRQPQDEGLARSQRVKASAAAEPQEIIVGYDALAIYVHKDNPLDSISMEELAEIYGEGGKITKLVAVGRRAKLLGNDTIIRVSRQNSSGTYVYFREAVLGKTANTSSARSTRAARRTSWPWWPIRPAPSATAAWAMPSPDVKMLKVSKRRGEPGVAPTVENAKKQWRLSDHPAAADLHRRRAQGEGPRHFLDWILGVPGQKVVVGAGIRAPAQIHERAEDRPDRCERGPAADRIARCLDVAASIAPSR